MPRFRLLTAAVATLLFVCPEFTRAQAPQTSGPDVKPGALPTAWIPGGPKCVEVPEFQVHEYNEDLYILRQSGCSHYEKPFLYLLFGNDKALLLDTGAGKTELALVVRKVVERWLTRNKRDSIEMVVAHTHAHDDHTAGDAQMRALPLTTVVPADLKAVHAFFGFKRWPDEIVKYDLGGRALDVIPIPGHEQTSIAVYDAQTGILFTGDTLYPGRLYVEDQREFARSVRRLVLFTRDKLVTHILGNHIENTRTPYVDYPIETAYQPAEHALELGRSHLLELGQALEQMEGRMFRLALRDFTIWPVGR